MGDIGGGGGPAHSSQDSRKSAAVEVINLRHYLMTTRLYAVRTIAQFMKIYEGIKIRGYSRRLKREELVNEICSRLDNDAVLVLVLERMLIDIEAGVYKP